MDCILTQKSSFYFIRHLRHSYSNVVIEKKPAASDINYWKKKNEVLQIYGGLTIEISLNH